MIAVSKFAFVAEIQRNDAGRSSLDPTKSEHWEKTKDLISYLIQIRKTVGAERNWTVHFKGILRLLDYFADPTDKLVDLILEIACEDSEEHWELNDVTDFLHRYRDAHPKRVAELFLQILRSTQFVPTYPSEKVRELCLALILKGEKVAMAEICRIYGDRSNYDPIRDICERP